MTQPRIPGVKPHPSVICSRYLKAFTSAQLSKDILPHAKKCKGFTRDEKAAVGGHECVNGPLDGNNIEADGSSIKFDEDVC